MVNLTLQQRYTMENMLKVGYKQSEIALAIGKDTSVASREIKRNCDQRTSSYSRDLAQRKYYERQKREAKVSSSLQLR